MPIPWKPSRVVSTIPLAGRRAPIRGQSPTPEHTLVLSVCAPPPASPTARRPKSASPSPLPRPTASASTTRCRPRPATTSSTSTSTIPTSSLSRAKWRGPVPPSLSLPVATHSSSPTPKTIASAATATVLGLITSPCPTSQAPLYSAPTTYVQAASMSSMVIQSTLPNPAQAPVSLPLPTIPSCLSTTPSIPPTTPSTA